MVNINRHLNIFHNPRVLYRSLRLNPLLRVDIQQFPYQIQRVFANILPHLPSKIQLPLFNLPLTPKNLPITQPPRKFPHKKAANSRANCTLSPLSSIRQLIRYNFQQSIPGLKSGCRQLYSPAINLC